MMGSSEEFNGSTALALLYEYSRAVARSKMPAEGSVVSQLFEVVNRSMEGWE